MSKHLRNCRQCRHRLSGPTNFRRTRAPTAAAQAKRTSRDRASRGFCWYRPEREWHFAKCTRRVVAGLGAVVVRRCLSVLHSWVRVHLVYRWLPFLKQAALGAAPHVVQMPQSSLLESHPTLKRLGMTGAH
mmetsp:Transcript_68968/g.159873  ORF Transcript_68968/g.159873 Transcript_68968/m.159873 type:complete len:131 (+) Transcript_68968:1767-2159(+)